MKTIFTAYLLSGKRTLIFASIIISIVLIVSLCLRNFFAETIVIQPFTFIIIYFSLFIFVEMFRLEKASGFKKQFAILPINRKKYVLALYLLTLIIVSAGILFSIVNNVIIYGFSNEINYSYNLLIGFMIFSGISTAITFGLLSLEDIGNIIAAVIVMLPLFFTSMYLSNHSLDELEKNVVPYFILILSLISMASITASFVLFNKKDIN